MSGEDLKKLFLIGVAYFIGLVIIRLGLELLLRLGII